MRGAQIPGGRITFHYPSGSWRLRPARRYKHWLRTGLAMESHRQEHAFPGIEHIAYYFVPPSEIISLHEKLMGDPSPTDVITLDYRQMSNTPLLAEIFVCPAFVRASARMLGQPYAEELRRVLAHGILHLLGYRDLLPEGRLRMRSAEERWLSLWNALRPVSHETLRV